MVSRWSGITTGFASQWGAKEDHARAVGQDRCNGNRSAIDGQTVAGPTRTERRISSERGHLDDSIEVDRLGVETNPSLSKKNVMKPSLEPLRSRSNSFGVAQLTVKSLWLTSMRRGSPRFTLTGAPGRHVGSGTSSRQSEANDSTCWLP